MISYFKANDPYRLIAVLIVLIFIRIFFYWLDSPLLVSEVKWMLIGEKLGSGAVMYRDLWDSTPPLAALMYKWIYLIFGKTRVPYLVLSTVLVIIQAGVFNYLLISNKAYSENTYVPALIYAVCMNLFIDFATLSPVLMAGTFLLLVLNNLFKRMDNTTRDELFLFTGVYLALATLFYLPSVLCLFATLLALALYTGSIVRRMLLLIYGYGVVMILASLVFYWSDAGAHFHSFFYGSVWTAKAYRILDFSEVLVAILIPLSLLIFSIIKIVQYGRYINFQIKIQYVMIFFIVSGILGLSMLQQVSTYQLIYFVPFLAFFISHYLLTIKNVIMIEATAVLVIVVLLVNNLMTREGWLIYDSYVDYKGMTVEHGRHSELIKNKKVLIIDDWSAGQYVNGALATPFLEWQFSKEVLTKLDFYDNSTLVYQSFRKDLPEVILDNKDVIPSIFYRLPEIASKYKVLSGSDNTYVLR